MITYERYAELLGKRIHRTITEAETADVETYEAAQPNTCPKCSVQVRSFFMPQQIVHDVEKCTGKVGA